MGILFTLISWGVLFAILSLLLGLIALAIAAITCKGKQRKRKLLLCFCTPTIAILSYSASSLVVMIVIALACNIDIGIGDSWVAPLNQEYKLTSVDTPERAEICRTSTGEILLDEITEVELRGDSLIGKSMGTDGRYFIFNLETGHSQRFNTRIELCKVLSQESLNLIPNIDFYWNTRKLPYIIGSILCLLFTLISIYLFWRIGLAIPSPSPFADIVR